jgi:hypothetical protein
MGWQRVKSILIFAFLLLPLLLHAEEKPFVFVIRAFNNKSWYQKNLDSVFQQHYNNFRVILVIDGSNDGSDVLIEDYVEKKGYGHRIHLFKNSTQKGDLACACQAIFSCREHEIVAILDGHDWLPHDQVLPLLNEHYADPDVWMTYGTCTFHPKEHLAQLDGGEKKITSQRHLPREIAPLRTFYASLFHAIEKDHFLHERKFLPLEDGSPYLIPILEMAGSHAKKFPYPSYTLNLDSSLDDHCSTKSKASPLDHLPRYSPLVQLPSLYTDIRTPHGKIYRQIKDIFHPILKDFQLINSYLLSGERIHLDRLADIRMSQAGVRILSENPSEQPESGLLHVNTTGEKKENCILLYSTFNRNYPKGVKRQLSYIADSDFQGDVLYRIGGWPDEAGGSLVLAHVPYAFKASFFKEAERRGYKRILWMDSSVLPAVSLNQIFRLIEEKGYLVMGNAPFMTGPFMNPQAAAFFGITHEETHQIPCCSAAVLGLDLTKKRSKDLLDHWYRAAQDPDAFFSARADQNALSILLYQYQIFDLIDIHRMPHPEFNHQVDENSLFTLDRLFIR